MNSLIARQIQSIKENSIKLYFYNFISPYVSMRLRYFSDEMYRVNKKSTREWEIPENLDNCPRSVPSCVQLTSPVCNFVLIA